MRRKPQPVALRRKREGKTDYRKRLRVLQAGKLRLVIRPSLANMMGQVIEFHPKGDRVLIGLNTVCLEKYGWKAGKGNIPAAYLIGYLLGRRAVKAGLREAVLDIGLFPSVKGSRIYACLKGVLDGGLKVAYSEKVLPAEERIRGKHIVDYAQKLGEFKIMFSDYIKKGVEPVKVGELFDEVKKKIEEEK